MPKTHPDGTATEVLAAFLKLGLTSFGGPVAHLGYFRDELVTRRGWLSEADYADLVALCQFLPGPASSQVGFALGLMRAGWRGALAAFAAFTLPSALLLIAFAYGAAQMEGPLWAGALHGLKLVAVAIVAQAVWGMGRSLCAGRAEASLAVGAVAVLALLPGPTGMAAAIALGAFAGRALLRREATAAPTLPQPVTRRTGVLALALFALLLVGLPLLANLTESAALFDRFYRAGALVFGGGHVVLPLLEAETVTSGWISPDGFLAGYGAAQAVPGPLFTFAAYLGTAIGGISGAGIALAAIFLPGFLLLIGALPFWTALSRHAAARGAMAGANAAVVGVLGAALYDPVFTSAVHGRGDLALALAGWAALTVWKVPPWAVVCAGIVCGAALGLTAGL